MKSLKKDNEPRKKIRILVIQLAKLGDTLQSLMALRAAKQLYPELEIHMLVRERFSGAAKRVPWLSGVYTLPTEALVGPTLKGKRSETQSLGDVARWLAPVIHKSWDSVVNWSYSEASSYLTALIPARVKLGFSRRRDLSFSAVDGWSHYIQGIVQQRANQNVHLTDILTTQLLTALQIHYGEPANEGNSPVTSKSFFNLEIGESDIQWTLNDSSRKWIGIQVGASEECRTWAPERWAELIDWIRDRHPEYGFVLLGNRSDATRAKTIIQNCTRPSIRKSRVISLVGETDFDLWASVVARCQWLFSGDTAAIQLASVLGTRVLNVSTGPTRWQETGPYGNGHYVVRSRAACSACDRPEISSTHQCGLNISAGAVYAAWQYASTEWNHRKQAKLEDQFVKLGIASEADKVHIFRSRIRSTQDGGGVHYEPVFVRPMTFEDWCGTVMGHIARAWYCGWVPPVGSEISRDRVDASLMQKLRLLDEPSQVMGKITDEAQKTALLLNRLSGGLKSQKVMRITDREGIQDLGKRLADLDQLLSRTGQTIAPLDAFDKMAKVMMHNLRSDKLSELGTETAGCYVQLSEGLQILRSWIRHTLEISKPVAVRGALKLIGPTGEKSP